ncbi:MAG: hypothetical protein P9X22_05265 [Candidatus Zapsychrus exili]|nr:hypothetical protein [Candidatus Zapsychrus exili]
MKNYLENLDKEQLVLIKKIGDKADSLKKRAYIVGGVVRDIILDKKSLDLDIAIVSDAIDFAKNISKIIKGRLVVYSKFKTATLFLNNGASIDFVMARKESYKTLGALPDVELGSLRDDLFRRDFTINAIGISINKNSFGNLIDEFKGVDDLKKKKIRVLHNKSFIDDPTRILRAIRFEARLGFQIENKTLKLLKQAIDKNAPDTVTSARYFNEFRKMFKEDDPVKCLKRLRELGAEKFLGFRPRMCLRNVRQLHLRLKDIGGKNIGRSAMYMAALFKKLKIKTLEDNLEKFQITKKEKKIVLEWYKSDDILNKLS